MKKNVLFICFYILVVNIQAQEVFTLSQCLDSSFKNNLRIVQQRIAEKNYSLNIRRAENGRLPNVNGNINGNTNWGRGIDPFTNTYINQQFNTYNGGINLDLNLFNGFYHINNIKLQKQDIDKNKSELQKIKNDLTIDIAMRYTNILYLQEMIKNIKEQITLSNANIDFTQKKIDAGALAKKEIYKAISQKESEELNLLTTENSLEVNKLELKQLMGISLDKAFNIAPFDIADQKFDFTSFITTSFENSPSLKLRKTELEKSKLSMQIAKSGLYPSLSLGGQIGSTYSTFNRFFNFEQQLDNNLSYGLNLNARFPIFNQFSTRNKIAESKLNIESSQNQIEIEKQNLYKTLNKTFLDLTTSQKKLKVSNSLLESNRINYDIDKLKYEAGRISIQELNISKSNLFSSQSNVIKDTYELLFNRLMYEIYQSGN